MKVVLAAEAVRDIEQIGDYIAGDSPRRARTFIAELRGKIRAIGEGPWSFPLVPGYEGMEIRRHVFASYLIFYRVEEDQVAVIHVLHGAQDYETLIFPDA